MNNVFLKISLKIVSPLILLSSVYVLLKGHNEPGGGFIGGLLAALSWTLVKIGSQIGSPDNGKDDFSKENFYILGIGLAFSLFSGLVALFYNEPLFTGIWGQGKVYVPSLGDLKLSTIMFFDIGVYIVVLFASVKMLRSFMD